MLSRTLTADCALRAVELEPVDAALLVNHAQLDRPRWLSSLDGRDPRTIGFTEYAVRSLPAQAIW